MGASAVSVVGGFINGGQQAAVLLDTTWHRRWVGGNLERRS